MPKIYGLDIETHDPHLRDKGPSWVYGEGEVLCTAVYNVQTGKKWAVKKWNNKVKEILLDPDAIIVGAKIDYDIGWLQYEMGITIKAQARDIFFAEALLDEYGIKTLDHLGKKYLKVGKNKSALEEWCADNGLQGDFRRHIKYAMDHGQWGLVKEYVLSDAELPCLIFEKQLPRLEAENLMAPFITDCKLIPIVLHMKKVGIRLDLSQREKSFYRLTTKYNAMREEFDKKHGSFNFNSTKQLAAFFDRQGADYFYKVTLKGRDGQKYEQNDRYITDDLKQARDEVERCVTGFRFKKKKLIMLIEKQYVGRVKQLLTKNGFMFTANPVLDKHALSYLSERYPVANEIQRIKKLSSILDKFLGEEFKRFICADGRLHSDFNISKSDDYGTISGRFSMSNPNLQQVPSKGESDDILLAEVCRELFLPEDNCWMLKIDYSQIEYRLLIHYAIGPGSNDARARFCEDPYTDYHKFVMSITGLDRKYAKNCFAVGSFVYTGKGAVRLGEEKDIVSIHNKVQGRRFEIQPSRSGLAIELSNGSIVRVTKDHPFLDFSRSTPVFKEAGEFSVGDQLGVGAMRFFGGYKEFRLGDELRHGLRCTVLFDECFAYVAGIYIGDGCLCKSSQGDVGHIRLCLRKENEAYVRSFFDRYGATVSVVHTYNGGIVINVASKALAHFFEEYFGNGTDNKIVPDFLFSSPESVIRSFIAGCYDTDSRITRTACDFIGKNEVLVRSVAKLLSFIGCNVVFGKERYRTNIEGKTYEGVLYKAGIRRVEGELPLLVKKEKMSSKLFTDRKSTWKIRKEDLAGLEHPSMHYYRKGQTTGLSREVVKDLSLLHAIYTPVTIVSITPDVFDVYVMETDDHTYFGEGVPSHNCNFGIMYGMGIGGMMEAFGWSKDLCEEILEKYHSALPYVKPTMEKVRDVAEKRGYITTIGGRKARCLVKESSYSFLNRLNQGGSADIMKNAMVSAWESGLFDIITPHITVHDELVCSVPKSKEGLAAVTELRRIMENVIPLKIPVIAEPELGRDWFHVDTRYWREKKNGEIELVSAFKVEDLKAAREHLRLGDAEPLVVSSGKKSLPVSVGDVIIHSLYGETSVISGDKFAAMFKEVA